MAKVLFLNLVKKFLITTGKVISIRLAPTADMGSPRYNNLRTYKQYLEQQKGLLKNYNQLTVNGIQNDETIYNIYIKPLINHKAGKANKICQ